MAIIYLFLKAQLIIFGSHIHYLLHRIHFIYFQAFYLQSKNFFCLQYYIIILNSLVLNPHPLLFSIKFLFLNCFKTNVFWAFQFKHF